MAEMGGSFMCLMKVYLDKEGERRLIAKDVALVVREGSGIKLRSLELMDVVSLEEVDISLIDTLNSVMIIKPKT
jgi:predicted RNA-binding protein